MLAVQTLGWPCASPEAGSFVCALRCLDSGLALCQSGGWQFCPVMSWLLYVVVVMAVVALFGLRAGLCASLEASSFVIAC